MDLFGSGAEGAGGRLGAKPLVLPGEPMLAYQPVVDLGSGILLGFEALVRWQHPTEGLILPGLLIPWAEANGDIVALGEFVLQEGCRHATEWPRSLQLAVNLSIVQLRRGVAARAVAKALEESGLPPDRLTVEVTEHVMSEQHALSDLRTIAEMGVQLAVDDVGTSWNSFDLLRRMEVNTIKIDGSFVTGLETHEGINRMVVETVVHLAHSSGMSTVAEGVETATHAAIVREFDSDAAQGYFFAPPLPVEAASELAAQTDFRFPMDGLGWMAGEHWAPRVSGTTVDGETGAAGEGEASAPRAAGAGVPGEAAAAVTDGPGDADGEAADDEADAAGVPDATGPKASAGTRRRRRR